MYLTHLRLNVLADPWPNVRPKPWRGRLTGTVVATALATFLFTALSACGGGGDGPTSPGNAPSAASVAASSYALINRARRDADLGPLLLDPALSEIARSYSQRMRDEGFFSHTDPAGVGPGARVRNAGVTFSLVGENLASVQGSGDPAGRAHDALLANQGHRRNMLERRFELVGVGVARSGNQYWITQIYLRP